MESTGKSPQKTTGTLGRKPGSAAAAGRLTAVMVSPTSQSPTSLMAAVMKPISPGPRLCTSVFLGVNTPTRSTSCSAPEAIMRIFVRGVSRPCRTRTKITTPR